MNVEPSSRGNGWAWLGAGLMLALLFFVWAGSAPDPRHVLPWTWTANAEGGTLTLSRGLAFLWVASAFLFAVLSRIAYRLMTDFPAPSRQRAWLTTAFVLALAILARIAIVHAWRPLPLDAALLSLPQMPTTSSWRWIVMALDVAAVCVLLAALARARRSVGWVALYALHPLTLWEIAGNGRWMVAAVLPLAVLAAIAPRFPRQLRAIALMVLAAAATAITAVLATRAPFNSLAAALLAFAPHPNARWTLPLLQAALQALVLLLAWARKWPFARTLGHMIVMLLLGSAVVYPSFVLLAIVLLPLAWNRAGWALSLAALLAYAAVPALPVTHHWAVPGVLVALAWVPVAVLELQELTMEAIAATRNPRTKITPAATTSDA